MFETKPYGMMEFSLTTGHVFKNPFWDVQVTARFSQGEVVQEAEAFYDGENGDGRHVWKVRWTPPKAGEWRCEVRSVPVTEGLTGSFSFHAEPGRNARGFLRAVSGRGWGLHFDNGEPLLVVGDTMYNLFGAEYCGVATETLLRHRQAQGVNYIRARAHVSAYHPEIRNAWQTKDTWPWGGSAQWPDFTRFRLDYFRAVDRVMDTMARLGLGVEMIMEAWMLEFPFNDRHRFLPEFEEHWIRYLISRYSAYPSLYIWCPANEYEFYPGSVAYHPEADRWFKRICRLIKTYDPVRHPIGAHNWEQKIPLSERLGDCADLDVYLVQSAWLNEMLGNDLPPSYCLEIESQLKHHAPHRDKPVICAEFGYEGVDGLDTVAIHSRIDHHHTRRGQWKAGFSGCHVVHGFNNTWGPHMTLEKDAKGAAYIAPFVRFMTELASFDALAPANDLLEIEGGHDPKRSTPLCLADADRAVIAVYFPTAGQCSFMVDVSGFDGIWYDPRTGEMFPAAVAQDGRFVTPPAATEDPLDDDWALLLRRRVSGEHVAEQR